MAEEQKKEAARSGARNVCVCEGECACGCGCGWPRGHRAFRVILALIILALVFWAGVKMGELRAYIEYQYANWGGYGMMGNGYGYGYGYGPMRYGSGEWGGYGYGANGQPTQAPQQQNAVQGSGTSSAPMIPATGTAPRP